MPTQKGLVIYEEAPGLFERLYARLADTAVLIGQYLISRDSFPAIVILIACAILTRLLLYKSKVSEEQFCTSEPSDYINPRRRERAPIGSPSRSPKEAEHMRESSAAAEAELKIIELKAETYNGMVRLLKPGFRSIVLLTDQASREKLLANFKSAVWPYRRNKILLFGYLCLDKNLSWYQDLLEQMTGRENLKLIKKNCIGTVLSLNGFKKYLRVYHAKHQENDHYDEESMHDNDYDEDADIDSAGAFLSFDRSPSPPPGDSDLERGSSIIVNSTNRDPHQEIVYTEDNLLDGLPVWLDKMFDGLTKRYFLDEWPEEIK